MATSIKHLIRKLSPFQDSDVDQWAAHMPEYLPIVPTSRLWLPRLGIGNDKRFAAIFRETWSRIPIRARRMMVKHWRMARVDLIWGLPWSPVIQLKDDWKFSVRFRREPRDLAAVGRGGHVICFYAPVVDAMPSEHVSELIAHELAHVTHFATGEQPSTDRTQPRWCDSDEIIADEIIDLWGFDPGAMDEWVERNWKWPD